MCIEHRREAPLMLYHFLYVGADIPKLSHQPGIQRTLRDHGYGLAHVSRDMPVYSPSFRRVLILA